MANNFDCGAQVAAKVPKATLADGNCMPLIGYGTSSVLAGTATANPLDDPACVAITSAIKSGYRFIDTAMLYMNEDLVGLAIEDCINRNLVKREELFVCTKVWCTSHKRKSVMKSLRDSLKRLRLNYVDLYMIHWPVAYVEDLDPVNPKDPVSGKLLYSDTHYTETWLGMEDCKDAGLAKSIGVSNFNHKMLDEILAMPCKHRPTVNQVECHPYLNQEKLLAYSNANNMLLTAYCPLGAPGADWIPDAPKVIEDPLVCQLAASYNKSPAQILLRFQLQRNVSVIPKSVKPERIAENINILDFELSAGDMDKLLALNKNFRYCINTAGEHVDDHPLYPFHEEF